MYLLYMASHSILTSKLPLDHHLSTPFPETSLSAIEPRILAYTLTSQGPSVTTEERHREHHYDENLSTTFIHITYTYESINRHRGGMLCTQAGGRRALS